MRRFDVLILGAGAAGLFCAAEAGHRGWRVAVLELADRVGKKILISGGGRCNFTNLHCRPDNFISANPQFAVSALARYAPADFIALVEKHRIRYHEKTLGQLFCDGSANEIVNLLEAECREGGVEIVLNAKVASVRRDSEFVVQTERMEFRAPVLVVATGGLSISKLGATPLGYQIARQFGLGIVETRPALVPFVLSKKDQQQFSGLAGVSALVTASADHHAFREKMLFTHRGLSGPAILQISSYWKPGQPIHIDLAPDRCPTQAVRSAKVRNLSAARSAFVGVLPKSFADRWLDLHAPQTWTNRDLERLEHDVHRWTLTPAGTEGYEKAEVTAGGVDTAELSSKTMECRKVSGLFFIGEVVDVTGHLGGFNFQWAWASAAAAARSM